MKLSASAKKNIKAVRDFIKGNPARFNQKSWARRESVDDFCSSTHCIAGTAILMAGYVPIFEGCSTKTDKCFDPKTGSVFSIEEKAQKLLGLTYQQASDLFDGGGEYWREDLAASFSVSDHDDDRAKIAVKELNHLLRTGRVN